MDVKRSPFALKQLRARREGQFPGAVRRLSCREALVMVEGHLEEQRGVLNVTAWHAEPLELPDEQVTFQSRDFR